MTLPNMLALLVFPTPSISELGAPLALGHGRLCDHRREFGERREERWLRWAVWVFRIWATGSGVGWTHAIAASCSWLRPAHAMG